VAGPLLVAAGGRFYETVSAASTDKINMAIFEFVIVFLNDSRPTTTSTITEYLRVAFRWKSV
jgi:hypothetical protein